MSNGFATIAYAESDEHGRLPVIDVTHPAFAVEADADEIARLARAFVQESRQRGEMPPHVREVLRRSRLGSGLNAAVGSFLSGMHTYMLKLGPDNLGEGFGDIDRRIASSFPAHMTRFRLQDMARHLADGLAPLLVARPGRPLRLINIAGGPASDSWNALIHLRATHPDRLAGRDIVIAILDIDRGGPTFGARAVEVLRTPGRPLQDVEARVRQIPYAWTQAADRLPSILADLGAMESICAISSEGGLFQYGSDADIIANLSTLRAATPPDAFVAGSVTNDDEPSRIAQVASGVPTRPMTVDAFRTLAATAGWIVDRVIERPFAYTVRLIKAA